MIKKFSGIFLLFVMLLSGCAYNGAIKPDFYNVDVTTHKIPLNVVLVQSDSIKTNMAGTNSAGYSVNIATHPGLINSVKTSFDSFFQNVKIVDVASGNVGANIVVLIEYDQKLVARNLWNGDHAFKTTMTLLLKDPITLETIETYIDEQMLRYTPSTTETIIDVITGASLFLLSPITIPMRTYALGKQNERLTEEDISKHIGILGAKISSDSKIIRLAL